MIDGDIVAHVCSSAGESTFNFGEDFPCVSANLEAIKDDVSRRVDSWIDGSGSNEYVIAMSEPSRVYHRHTYWPTYKAHRTHGRTPIYLKAIKEWIREKFITKEKPGLEADDVLGILQTMPGKPNETVIVTIDKDLAQIPGWHWNPNLKRNPWEVCVELADDFFYLQTLTGDPTDGFPGCPGIGRVRADLILKAAYAEAHGDFFDIDKSGDVKPACVWKHTLAAYARKGLDSDYALSQARCARILRACDYDFTERKAIPWTPPALVSPSS